MKALVIVAHPDDETLFLAGYILKNAHWDWTIISVTHSLQSERGLEFKNACEKLGATPVMLGLEDVYEKNLDQDLIVDRLKIIAQNSFDMIVTHNREGEYGHPHHISVHHAVKKVFKNPYFFGYNSFSDIDIKLNTWDLEKKKSILKNCYPSQSKKTFMNLFEVSIERIISPNYLESSIDASFFGKNDLWSYESSSYESARLERIFQEVEKFKPKSILEVGAHEGYLTEKLIRVAPVVALERSTVAATRGIERVKSATWVVGDFEKDILAHLENTPEAIILSEVIYYFNDYQDILRKIKQNHRYLLTQNVSKIHKQIETFLIEDGWNVRVSAKSNPFGLGVYEHEIQSLS